METTYYPISGELLKRLRTESLGEFLEETATEPVFHEYLGRLCTQTGDSRGQVIARAGIDRTYGYQLFNGTRKPSREKAIQLAFGFRLDLEQTQQLLRAAGKNPLEPRFKRDAAIIYCIVNRLSLDEAGKLFGGHGIDPPIGGEH
ncbi:MAG TPA: helix-turn-helix transcriptional regulator [Eubacteriales bacterium]|nr:helix-turn-helix transcriptional regulator [Eubacteriales bacterium]